MKKQELKTALKAAARTAGEHEFFIIQLMPVSAREQALSFLTIVLSEVRGSKMATKRQVAGRSGKRAVRRRKHSRAVLALHVAWRNGRF